MEMLSVENTCLITQFVFLSALAKSLLYIYQCFGQPNFKQSAFEVILILILAS